MRREEIRVVGELAGEALGGTGAFVRQIHEGIAGRPFKVLGPLALPVRVVHDRRVERGLCRRARRAGGAAPRGGRAAGRATRPQGARALAESPVGSLALGALNGAIGDLLAAPVRASSRSP